MSQRRGGSEGETGTRKDRGLARSRVGRARAGRAEGDWYVLADDEKAVRETSQRQPERPSPPWPMAQH